MKKIRVLLLSLLWLATSQVSVAEDKLFDEQQLKDRFIKIGILIKDVQPSSELPGLLELTTDQGDLISNFDGSYFLSGSLYSLDERGRYQDVLAMKKGPKIAKMLEEHSENMIVYKAANEKSVVTVFTDTSCGFCVKLHRNMKQYNDLGITVRYLAFPRGGMRGKVANTLANIWCATDPKQAMDNSKLRNQHVSESQTPMKDCQAIVKEQYELGKAIGVTGTPAVYTEQGINIGGYLEPAAMQARIEP